MTGSAGALPSFLVERAMELRIADQASAYRHDFEPHEMFLGMVASVYGESHEARSAEGEKPALLRAQALDPEPLSMKEDLHEKNVSSCL